MQACKKLPTAKRNKQRQVNSLSSVSSVSGLSECELTEWYAYDLYIHYSIYIYTYIGYASTPMWKSIAIFIFREFFPLYFFCETSWQGVDLGGRG